MDKTCEIHLEVMGVVDDYPLCGRPAKYMTPEYWNEKPKNVCGIHRRSIDQMHKRLNTGLKCTKIE